ncbi:MAG: tetratricopeptide repeat protein [Phycisphaerales bacterium]|nr:tetratricopeptide repeat protein [Phycisphaerales bacterium]
MLRKSEKSDNDAPFAMPTFSDEEIGKARQCFKRARELAEVKNYDYAIEWYINGLNFWPEAVEEGHKPCRAAALFRGGKKTSFGDQRKYKLNAKEHKTAMLNAEMLLSKAPQNLSYMEAMFKSAAQADFIDAVMWIGEIFYDVACREDKPNAARFECMRQVYEDLSDRVADAYPDLGIKFLERAVEALARVSNLKPRDMSVSTDLRDVTGKLTILKGKYSSAGSFRDSIHDADSQSEIHDKERIVQSDDRLDQLITAAKGRYEANPTKAAVVNELVDLLCRREREQDENQAIGLLVKAYQETREYRYKVRADDIRMKQLNRQLRVKMEAGDPAEAKEQYKEKLRYELKVFKDRLRHYPSDMRLRYEYGRRLFQAKHYDEAIPILQEARSDPKTRIFCSLYIGQCFYKKGYYDQAIETFLEAIKGHEISDDELGRQLHYWLGRAYEEDGQPDNALKIYGQLIQWDYNYGKGDVRKRIDELRKQKKKENNPDSSG